MSEGQCISGRWKTGAMMLLKQQTGRRRGWGWGDDEGILLGPNGLYLLSTQQMAPAARAMSQIALMSQI